MTRALSSVPRGGGRVRLDFRETWAEIVIDQPERRNAISPGMMLDLEQAVTRLEEWSGALVLLRGAGGRAFCSGGDLRAVRESLMEPEMAESMSEHMTKTLDRLAGLPQYVVAAVDGAALGGGAELLMCADWVVASADCRVGFVHIRLGVSPGWGGGRRLIRRVGRSAALRILVEGNRMRGEEALTLGMVDQLTSDPVVDVARARLVQLATRSPQAIRGAVSVARAEGASVEQAVFLELWGGPAHVRALDEMAKNS